MNKYFFIFFFFGFSALFAQKVSLSGYVTDLDNKPIELATVGVEGIKATQTNSDGFFEIYLPKNKEIVLKIRHLSYISKDYKLSLSEKTVMNFAIEKKHTDIGQIDVNIKSIDVVFDQREQVSITKIDPRSAKMLPSVFGDFSKTLATLPGVSSNNELSTAYSVRGGNFDENLVYVNGIQIYRPFLVRSGQQDGLSFVNSDLVSDIEFSAGGWQPKYGDKLSSVLSIQYRKPTEFAGTITAGRLGGALHLENASKNQRFTYTLGLRYKDSRAALNRMPTQAEYKPLFLDFQGYLTYDLTNTKKYKGEKNRASLEALLSYAKNDFYIEPETKTTTFGALTSQVKRLLVYFEGYENLTYDSYQSGIKYKQKFTDKLRTEFILSGLYTTEKEFFDILSEYFLCDVKIDFSDEETLNKCIFEQDIGKEYKYGRNRLDASVVSLENRWNYIWSEKSTMDFGYSVSNEQIKDTISEYSYIDSADFARINRLQRSGYDLNSFRHSLFFQNSVQLDSNKTLTYGFRSSYWTWNQQLNISPRVQYSWNPKWKKDFVFKTAAGIYHQPPFYREMRDNLGVVHKDVLAQRSLHLIAGADYVFKMWKRDFKFVSELYYKDIRNVIPYDFEDMKIRYRAHNDAQAYATGIDFRLSGEFIKGDESWFSLGLMQTKEDVENAFFKDVNGDTMEAGFVPRPSDQMVTFGVFFQDHMPKNPTLKMYLSMQFGSGLPFNTPGAIRYRYIDDEGYVHRTFGRMNPYRRVDVGFSKMLIFNEEETKKSKYFKSLWVSFEVLNILGVNNTISYSWVKDTYNTTYGIPNYLSARIWNLKMISKF